MRSTYYFMALLILWTFTSLLRNNAILNFSSKPLSYTKQAPYHFDGKLDLTIGMAFNIEEGNLMVFISSLRQYSSCHILLFVDNITIGKARFQKIKKQFNVDVMSFDIAKLEPSFMQKYHPSTLRWILMDQYLKLHSSNFQRILLADVRDTAFQSDPFQIIKEKNGFYTFSESIHFSEDGWNSGWVSDCFGSDVAAKMSNNWVVCSGISLGSSSAVAAYTSLMAAEILKPNFESCERNGVDQGIHNVLVYSNMIQNLTILGPSDGVVIHVQNTKLTMSSNSVVYIQDSKQPVKIVHQYDRHRVLQQSLLLKYVDWEISSNANGTGHCMGYSLLTNTDLFYGIGDIHNVPLAVPHMEGCCAQCSTTPECCGFVYASTGSCWLKCVCTRESNNPTASMQLTSGWLT